MTQEQINEVIRQYAARWMQIMLRLGNLLLLDPQKTQLRTRRVLRIAELLEPRNGGFNHYQNRVLRGRRQRIRTL